MLELAMVNEPSVFELSRSDYTLYGKRPVGRVVSTPDFVSRGPGFESRWRRNTTHDRTALRYSGPFTINLSSSRYDLNNVERDVNYQTIIITIIQFNAILKQPFLKFFSAAHICTNVISPAIPMPLQTV